MDREDALKVAAAIRWVDGECHVCAANLCNDLNKSLPQFDWFELLVEVSDWDLELLHEAAGIS